MVEISDTNKSGQIGLLLLVVLGLVISVVLSVALKSLSDVTLSRQDKESNQAFSLAEQGVEDALMAIINNDLPENEVSMIGMSGLSQGKYQINSLNSFDLYIKAGDQAELKLNGLVNNLSISWTLKNNDVENVDCIEEGEGSVPASLEVIVVKNDQTIERFYYNAYNCSLNNGFGVSMSGGDEFLSRINLILPSQSIKVRLRPFYSGATVRVEGVGLSTQMYLVKSKAQAGEAEKEIEVKRSLDSAGSVFDYALFSGSSIVK